MFYFTYDELKNKTNIKKHGVSFQEASTVFLDEDALVIDDLAHSTNKELRFYIIGTSSRRRILSVVFCERIECTFRIISARKSTKKEKNYYEKRKFH